MRRQFLLALGGTIVSFATILTPPLANAVVCYAQVGSACLKKSYGNLDSTCTNACAVALYMTKDTDGETVVLGGGLEKPAAVIADTKGTRPANCPNGAFYERSQDEIVSCEDDAVLSLKAPEAGMLVNGKPLPSGAMLLELPKSQ